MTRKEPYEFVSRQFQRDGEYSSESTKSRGEPAVGFMRLENFVMTGACLSSREERVVL